MVMNIVLAIATLATVVHGTTPDKILQNDFLIKEAGKGNHRLAGIIVGPNSGKCKLVRNNIKTFGYCWKDANEARNIDTSKERRWVREVVEQWEKCGGIKIVEEKACRTGSDFITINVDNHHPVVYPSVDTKTCKIEGFSMYTTFYTDAPEDWKGRERVRESMIKMYFLHEFGHFLGFDHEHNRKDRKDTCSTQVDKPHTGPDPYYGTEYISKEYDLDSIMNYCRPNVHYRPWLSDLDKKSVRQAYGGGNQAECDAVTKPWKWNSGEGIDDEDFLNELNGIPPACKDRVADNGCALRLQSCKDEGMKYWCPKSCNYCQ